MATARRQAGALRWMERSVSWPTGTTLVDRCAQHIHDATQRCLLPTGTVIGLPGVGHHDAAAQTIGRTQRNGTHHAVAQLLLTSSVSAEPSELQAS